MRMRDIFECGAAALVLFTIPAGCGAPSTDESPGTSVEGHTEARLNPRAAVPATASPAQARVESMATEPLACSLDADCNNMGEKLINPIEPTVAECNTQTGQCERVTVPNIHCGGFVHNPHLCPNGYVCKSSNPDVAGTCEPATSSSDLGPPID